MSQMNIQNSAGMRVTTGYFSPGEKVDSANVGTKLKNWLASTSLGKNVFKMDPPRCLCVTDNKGRHIATNVTSANFGQFAKVDLSGSRVGRATAYTPKPSTKDMPLSERGSGETNVERFHGAVKNETQLAKAKQEISEGFDKDFWNRDQMTIALYSKAVGRDQKEGAPIRPFITSFNADNPKKCETTRLLQGIKDGIKDGTVKEGQRFQMAIQTDAHWTPVDVKVINGQPHLFMLDAAQTSTGALCQTIRETFPDCVMYQYIDKTVRNLQFDDNSCSRFTVDHLSVMSRDVDLFERLEQRSNDGAFRNIERDGKKEYLVPTDDLPAGALRLLQSHSTLDKLSDASKNKVASQKSGQTEYQQALRNTVVDFQRGKVMNVGAEVKKESQAAKANEFLNDLNLEQFNKIMTYRSGEGLIF